MQQVVTTSARSVCNKVQQQVASVCFTSGRLPSLHFEYTQSAVGGSGPLCLPTSSKVVPKLRDHPCRRIIQIAPWWTNVPWFWDLVALSDQIPPCLPNQLTQSFNQIPHKNLSNLNHNAWLIEPQLSSTRAFSEALAA